MKINQQQNNVNFSGIAPFRIHQGGEVVSDLKIIRKTLGQISDILTLGGRNVNENYKEIARQFYKHDLDYRTHWSTSQGEKFGLSLQFNDRVPYIFSGMHAASIEKTLPKEKTAKIARYVANDKIHMGLFNKETNVFEKQYILIDLDERGMITKLNFDNYGASPLWKIPPKNKSTGNHLNFLL